MKLLPVVVLASVLWTCQSGQQSDGSDAPPVLLTYFSTLAPADTLYFQLGSDPLADAREIPVPLLYETLDSVLFHQMGYMQDTAAMQFQARSIFPLDAEHDAALLALQEGWYDFQYLLLFDKPTGQFTGVAPVCEFYGGDGGQIRSESWLFFKEPPRLLTRYSERWLQMGTPQDPDEVRENFAETARLWEWTDGAWREVPVQDSSRWVKDFPVAW